MPDEVPTTKEVAALLKLAETTLCAAAQAGESPTFTIWEPPRIKPTELDQRLEAQPDGGEGRNGE